MRCDHAATTLAALVDGEPAPSAEAVEHIDRCLRCQAQLAQHRRLRRTMGRLRSQWVVPAPGLLDQVLAAVDQAADAPVTRGAWGRHRAAYVAAATAATAAGAVLLASRSRRTRLVAAG